MKANKVLIKSIKKDKKKYSVETNVGNFLLSEDSIVKNIITKEKEIDFNDFSKILEKEKTEDLFNSVLKYLSYSARSVNEVCLYLSTKNASDSEKKIIIERLKNLNYLNDEKLSIYLLDYYIRSFKGPKYLENKLKEKGIANDIILKRLDEFTFEKEKELINTILEKEKNKLSSFPIKIQRNKLLSKLSCNGFNLNTSISTINEFDFFEDISSSIKKDYEKALFKFDGKEKSKEKIISFLLRKGYSYDDIKVLFKDDE